MPGPFLGRQVKEGKPVYTLTFKARTDEEFSVGAHLKRLSGDAAKRLGADLTEGDVEILCADPMESDSRIRHMSVATITPDFMGLSGHLTIKARPDSRFQEVVDEIGVKLWASFTED